MGGIYSGRYWHKKAKDTTDDYRAIDVRRWHRDKLLIPNQSFVWKWIRNGKTLATIQAQIKLNQIILSYCHRPNDDWMDQNYPVYLVWTPCHYGNKRPWFICPAQNCMRRVAILYFDKIFACRHCHQLAYRSQREAITDRATRGADKIRERLQWEPGSLNGNGVKPKGMHWNTFVRLSVKHDEFVAQSLEWIGCRFNLMGEHYHD